MPHAEPQPSRELRRRRFAEFVRRHWDAAKERGMSVKAIEEATGVSKSTLYRWMDGDWSRDPRASEVRSLCIGLGASLEEAHRMLGWDQSTANREPEPITDDPDLRAVMRILNDPNTQPIIKLVIRRQLRALARRVEDADDE
jgi:transcriptional regulator with XRE-family HTH domain